MRHMQKACLLGLGVMILSVSAHAMEFDPYNCFSAGKSEIFSSVFQRFSNAKHDDGYTDQTKYTATAGAVGYKYSTQQWTAGASLSYEYGESRNYLNTMFSEDYLKMRQQTVGFALFGEYRGQAGWYGKGSAFVGFAEQKPRDAYGSFVIPRGYYGYSGLISDDNDNSTNFAGSLEIGKAFDLGGAFFITPHAGFDYAYTPSVNTSYTVYSPGFGLIPSGMSLSSQHYFELPIGVKLAKDFNVGSDWLLRPSLDLTLVPSVGNISEDNMNTRTGFAAYNGSEWKVYGIGADHWGGRVSAGIDAIKSQRFDLGLNYTYEGRKDYNDHRLTAAFGMSF